MAGHTAATPDLASRSLGSCRPQWRQDVPAKQRLERSSSHYHTFCLHLSGFHGSHLGDPSAIAGGPLCHLHSRRVAMCTRIASTSRHWYIERTSRRNACRVQGQRADWKDVVGKMDLGCSSACPSIRAYEETRTHVNKPSRRIIEQAASQQLVYSASGKACNQCRAFVATCARKCCCVSSWHAPRCDLQHADFLHHLWAAGWFTR